MLQNKHQNYFKIIHSAQFEKIKNFAAFLQLFSERSSSKFNDAKWKKKNICYTTFY